MPELAEVEYFRKQWNPGLGGRVLSVTLHPQARIYRGMNPEAAAAALRGRRLEESLAHGKLMAFRFSGSLWMGIHLGMTGSLRLADADFREAKHDHLVLRQASRALVLSDPRQFGRVLFHEGKSEPFWWADRAPSPTSASFTLRAMTAFLRRHPRLPLKAALLMQAGFPGIGNWMADEILWQSRLSPRRLCGGLTERPLACLWRVTRHVCRGALRTIGRDWSDPPRGWLFHERWDDSGSCPKHGTSLRRETVGGRTTAWCPRCQG